LENLDAIAEAIRRRLENKNAVRDRVLVTSRELVRHCSLAIRAIHRGETAEAEVRLQTAWGVVQGIEADLAGHPDLYWAGYIQDALKEYAEARCLQALLTDAGRLPTPEGLHVPDAAYLNGLAEASTELRRYILDTLRQGTTAHCETLLTRMDDLYTVLVTMDFPDAITGGLRRTTDVVRGVLEKTRGDLTFALRQDHLEAVLTRVKEVG